MNTALEIVRFIVAVAVVAVAFEAGDWFVFNRYHKYKWTSGGKVISLTWRRRENTKDEVAAMIAGALAHFPPDVEENDDG